MQSKGHHLYVCLHLRTCEERTSSNPFFQGCYALRSKWRIFVTICIGNDRNPQSKRETITAYHVLYMWGNTRSTFDPFRMPSSLVNEQMKEEGDYAQSRARLLQQPAAVVSSGQETNLLPRGILPTAWILGKRDRCLQDDLPGRVCCVPPLCAPR